MSKETHEFLSCSRESGAIILESPTDDSLLVLDRFGKTNYRLHPNQEIDEFGRRFLSRLKANPPQSVDRILELAVLCGNWSPTILAPLFSSIGASVPENATLRIRFIVDDYKYFPWWERLGLLYRHLIPPLHKLLTTERVTVCIESRMSGRVPENFAEFLVRERISLWHVCLDTGTDLSDDICEDLLRACSLGLRIPVIFYVRPESDLSSTGMIARALQASQYSGLAVRPIQMHPDYDAAKHGKPVAAEAFLGLVNGLYLEFPYYDDVLEPVNLAVAAVDPSRGIRDSQNLLLRRDGQLQSYRKIPYLGRAIGSIDELGALAVDDLRQLILGHLAAVDSRDARCSPCPWLEVCRGMDVAGDDVFNSTCSTWQYLLEMLVWARAAPIAAPMGNQTLSGQSADVDLTLKRTTEAMPGGPRS